MSTSAMEMVAAAKAAVPAISPQEVMAMVGRDDVLVVDVRDDKEVAATGTVVGAIHVTRGMLEFRADDTLPSHNPAFAKDKTVIVYCASGGRSALAGKALKDMGYKDVRNMGGFQAWVDAGGKVER